MNYIIIASIVLLISNIGFRVLWAILDKKSGFKLKPKSKRNYDIDITNVKGLINSTSNNAFRTQLKTLLLIRWIARYSTIALLIVAAIVFFNN